MMQTAGNLGLPVSAVGIETSAQWDGLRALGCAEGQGFLFATPLPLSGLWILATYWSAQWCIASWLPLAEEARAQ